MQAADIQKKLRSALLLSFSATIAVVAVKFVAAWISDAVSVLAEALQSTVDIVVSGVAVLTLRYAALPPDEKHPYGHGRAENLGGLFQLVVVLLASGLILVLAVQRLLNPRPIEATWGIAAMIFTVIVNTSISIYLSRIGARHRSAILQTEAVHLRSDSYASLGILVGLVLVLITGWNQFDPIAALVFVGFSVFEAIRHMRKMTHELMDGALPEEELRKAKQVLDNTPELKGYHALRSRSVGARRFVELHALFDDHISFVEAHRRAEQLEANLAAALDGAKVTVHYEPHEEEVQHQREHHAQQ